MPTRKIIIEPDPILRKKSESLEKVDNELRKLMDDMLKTMYAAPGIGLAAVQVGILKRLIVIDVSKDDNKKAPLFIGLCNNIHGFIGVDVFNISHCLLLSRRYNLYYLQNNRRRKAKSGGKSNG